MTGRTLFWPEGYILVAAALVGCASGGRTDTQTHAPQVAAAAQAGAQFPAIRSPDHDVQPDSIDQSSPDVALTSHDASSASSEATKHSPVAVVASSATNLDQTADLRSPTAEEVIATPPPGSEGQWTLQQIEELALSNNPTLRLAESSINKERGNWTQVGLYPNPIAGYLRSDPDKSSQSRTNGGFVQQTFITGGKLRLAREQESFGIQNTVQGLEAQRHRVVNDVRSRYYEVLGTQKTLDLAREVEQNAAKAIELDRKLLDAKEISRLDLVKSEMQLKRIRLAISNAKAQHAAAWQHLADMAGVPDMPRGRLAGNLEQDLPQLDRETEWIKLRNDSPLFQQLNAQVGVARKGWELARAQCKPDVTGQVVVERDSTNQFTNVQTLVALPLPLFNRNQGGIYNAYHELRRAQAEIERTELALRDSFAVAFRSYESAYERVTVIRDELLPDAQSALDMTNKGFQTGELPLSEVLSSRELYFETVLEYTTALTELRVAANEVEGMQLSGGLNPAELGTAIQGAGGSASQRRAVQQLLQQQGNGQLKRFTPGTTGD